MPKMCVGAFYAQNVCGGAFYAQNVCVGGAFYAQNVWVSLLFHSFKGGGAALRYMLRWLERLQSNYFFFYLIKLQVFYQVGWFI